MAALRVLSVKPPFQASKWLHSAALLENMDELLSFGLLFPLKGEKLSLEPIASISSYPPFIEAWKRGEFAKLEDFAFAFTLDEDALYALETPHGYQIKPRKAVVEISTHYLNISDGEVRSNVYGPDTLSWGVQFGFPQLHQTEEEDIVKHLDAQNYPLYKKIQSYLRDTTIPAKFGDIQSSVRLSKTALPWVNRHPWLKEREIVVS